MYLISYILYILYIIYYIYLSLGLWPGKTGYQGRGTG